MWMCGAASDDYHGIPPISSRMRCHINLRRSWLLRLQGTSAFVFSSLAVGCSLQTVGNLPGYFRDAFLLCRQCGMSSAGSPVWIKQTWSNPSLPVLAACQQYGTGLIWVRWCGLTHPRLNNKASMGIDPMWRHCCLVWLG